MGSFEIIKKIVSVKLKDASPKKETLKESTSNNRFSPVRPEVLECDIHSFKVQGVPHVVLVGLIDGKPYELFVTQNQELDTQKHTTGYIKKAGKSRYDLLIENGEQRVVLQDISKSFDSEYGTLSRFISMSLRHAVPLEFVVDQLAKDKNFIGFERAVSRVLKKYIAEGTRVQKSESCPQCGGTSLVYVSGCKSCQSCGWSKCE